MSDQYDMNYRREASAASPRPSTFRNKQQKGAPSRSHTRHRDNRPGIIRFFADARTHYAFGILLVITAVVMLIMCISHLRHGAEDHSMAAWQSVSEMASVDTAPKNAGGPLGAKISYLLMTEGLGIGSFALVIYLAVIGLSILKLIKIKFWPFTFKCIFTAISLSIIFGLLTLNSESLFHWGGRHGRQINLWLESIGSVLLSYAVTIALACALGCVYLHQLTLLVNNLRRRLPRRTATSGSRKDKEATRQVAEVDFPDEDVSASVRGFDEDDNFDISSSSKTVAAPATSREGLDDTQDKELENSTGHNSVYIAPETYVPDNNPETESSPTPVPEDINKVTNRAEGEDIPFNINVPSIVVEPVPEDEASEGKDVIPTAGGYVDPGYYDPRAELSHYRFPTLDLLEERDTGSEVTQSELDDNKEMLVKALLDYKIKIDSISATVGPSVTLYEIVPAEGIRIAQIRRLEDDIARNLSAIGIRIIAPIPGKGTVGIEVPNRKRRMVSIREVLGSKKFRDNHMELPIALGRCIDNEVFIQDLADIPHLLVAGATGQGKSVGLNCILASLLYARHPMEMKLVLIDPKKVEFSLYAKLNKHFLARREDDEDEPIITDPDKATATLKSICTEMDNRYELLKAAGVNKVLHYNRKIIDRRLAPVDGHRYLPYIVVVVDEYADLVMMGAKEISISIARIAQKGRAAGIHVIIATQRPSTDVITGMIKANFPGRMAFRTMQAVDSKTILDRTGANQLIGYGDMLFRVNGPMERVQCAFIDTEEIERITEFIDNQTGCPSAYILPEAPVEGGASGPGGITGPKDAMFDECARFIVTQPTASTSSLQRRFGIGYNKAGKIMDQLEALRVVGPAQGQKPRAVLMDPDTLEDLLRTL